MSTLAFESAPSLFVRTFVVAAALSRFGSKFAITAALALLTLVAPPALAQDEIKPIGPFVLDVRATMPRFPDSGGELAASRGLAEVELPGAGVGLDVGAHVYLAQLGPATVGLGVQATLGRSHASAGVSDSMILTRPVTETFTSLVPQISFNFGGGDGWSYLSGGVGVSGWQITVDDGLPAPADEQRYVTINYGAGARWFLNHLNRHVAFTFDIRFYVVKRGEAALGFPGSPQARFMILGAGISLRR